MGLLERLKLKSKKPDVPAKTGLCLGGGGARGYAHLGALKAFEEAGISFDLCGGTSVGSLVAALYCAGVKADELIKMGESLKLKDIHNGLIIAPNDPYKIGRVVTNIIGDADIEHLPKKFFAVAVDLVEGRQVILDKGKVATAVSASCCVPLFFKPVQDKGRHLVDGGLLNNIPADVCRMMGAEKVVTVDINPTRGGGTKELGLLEVLKATFSIMSAGSSTSGIINSDVLIAADTSRYSSSKKDGYESMIELGYEAAKAQIDAIKSLA